MIEHNDPRLQICTDEHDQDIPSPKLSKSKKALIAYNVTVLSGAGLAFLGFAAYGFSKFVEDRRSSPQYFSYQPKNERPLDRLEELIKFPENTPPEAEAVKRYLVANYNEGRVGLEAFSDFELKTGNSDEIKKTIRDKRIKLAFLGAEILALEDPEKNIVVDEVKGEVTFEGKYFDIKNSRHLFILDEIIGQNFILIDPDKTPEEQYKASKWIEDLNWLADSNVPVQFESNDIGYPPNGSLHVLARFYRTLDRLGIKDLPKKINYVPHLIDQRLGYAGGIYRSQDNEIDISESSGIDAIPHEEAHHQADVYSDFSQLKFNQLVNDVKSKVQGDYDPKDTFITPGVMDSAKTGSNTEVEDYAETIRMYFWDGVAFRRRIKELKYANSDAAVVLEAKYDFGKLLSRGDVFTKEGEVFSPQIGDVFEISDPDPAKVLIPLREEPIEQAVFTGNVRDTNDVKILEGPVTAEYKGEEVRMWKVVLGGINKDVGFAERHYAAQGWISEGWFGERVLAKEAEVFQNKLSR